jgi:UDP-N-acetylglucosamine--N-acetylmuramyl-(pentapeptide) pyrophosphoryl-undecaprenol N-acetylglucosamine transferase
MPNAGKSATLNVVFAGGGTAGHLFPGLAVAERLMEETPCARVTFFGSGKPFEYGSVASAGFAYQALPCLPMPRHWREVVPSLWTNAAGYFAARHWLARNACDVVVGLGGYASAATARAAVDDHIPLLLLEQNAVPGRVTRWLAARAAVVCLAFEQARERLPAGCRAMVTGNPIRPGFARAIDAREPVIQSAAKNLASPPSTEILCRADDSDRRRLLILGGSAGAQSLNRAVPKALEQTRRRLQGWEIVHQSGPAGLDETRELYAKLGLKATVAPFVVEMPAMLAGAELVICRAGGTTLAELAAAGVPALLVPYPHAADDHQRSNAEVLVEQGACLMLDEGEAGRDFEVRLADVLAQVLDDRAARRRMGAAMRRRARPDAAADVVAVIRRVERELALGPSPRAEKRSRPVAA